MDFAAKRLVAQIPAQEDRLDRPAKLGQCLVGRVHHLGAGEAAQDRFRIGEPAVHGCGIFDHLVILLLDLIPVDSAGKNGKQVGQFGAETRMRQRQLLPGDRFEPWRAARNPSSLAEGKADGALAMAVDILPLDLHVRAMPQHALDHRSDLRRRTALELREDAGRALVDMPVDHHAATAIADMPFGHQVAVPGAELLGIRSAGRTGLAPDGGVADGQCRIRERWRRLLRALPGERSAGRREAIPRN